MGKGLDLERPGTRGSAGEELHGATLVVWTCVCVLSHPPPLTPPPCLTDCGGWGVKDPWSVTDVRGDREPKRKAESGTQFEAGGTRVEGWGVSNGKEKSTLHLRFVKIFDKGLQTWGEGPLPPP